MISGLVIIQKLSMEKEWIIGTKRAVLLSYCKLIRLSFLKVYICHILQDLKQLILESNNAYKR